MLKIKKSHYEGYIVYDPRDFDNFHTHTCFLRVALVIKDNVTRKRIPKSRKKETIISHIRVSQDKIYLERLYEILKEIEDNKKMRKEVNSNGKNN